MANIYTPPGQVPPSPGGWSQLSSSDERTWAMLAHLSVLINIVTGILGPVTALVIYLVFRDKSRYVAYHSLQSLVFQLIWWLGGWIVASILWIAAGALTMICIGVVIIPIALVATLLPLAALVYGIIGAIQTSQGQDFRYWLIGDWVRDTLTGVGTTSGNAG
ncbi:MAG TPA: DUF4870 domain-containing protein [Anaerolineaceae bacterium]|nr:DUF4870 domain-containing protein [Anaerolineaceae bacterium]